MRVLFFCFLLFLADCQPKSTSTCPCRTKTGVSPTAPADRSTPPVSANAKSAEVVSLYQDSAQVPEEIAKLVENIGEAFSGGMPVQFSLSLSRLAAHMQSYQGKPLTPLSMVELAGQWGISSPWILQSTLVARGYGMDVLAQWAAKNIAAYRSQHGITHFGLSLGKLPDGSDLVILLMQRRRFEHGPFARWVEPGQTLMLRGRLEPGVFQLEALITAPDNRVSRATVPLEKNGVFSLKLDFCKSPENRGHYNVELMGKDDHGPFVAALFPVACGKDAALQPVSVQFQDAVSELPADAFAQAVFDRVNAYREKRSMPPFRKDARLTAVAQAHSEEMCRQKKIFHVSPTSGSPLDRVLRARLEVQLVAENVAMGPTPDEVVGAWIKSEGHRLNMEHAKGTHAGVGVCRGVYGQDTVVYYVTLLIVLY